MASQDDFTRKLSDADWKKARIVWEADPKLSFADLAKQFGVSRQRMSGKARDQGWRKVDAQERIAQKAMDQADARERAQPAVPPVVDRERIVVEEQSPQASPESEAAAVDLRANIITRHREETNAVRKTVYEALRQNDFNKGKLAKISAESMEILHRLERTSYGLESKGGNEQSLRIVVERRET